jgi:hypothetical protein
MNRIVVGFLVDGLAKQGYDIGGKDGFQVLTKSKNIQAVKAIMANSHSVDDKGEVQVDVAATQREFDAVQFQREYGEMGPR